MTMSTPNQLMHIHYVKIWTMYMQPHLARLPNLVDSIEHMLYSKLNKNQLLHYILYHDAQVPVTYQKKVLMMRIQQVIQQVVPHHLRPYKGNISSYNLVYHTKNNHLSQTNVDLNDLFHIIYKIIQEVLIGSYFPSLDNPLFVNLSFYLFIKTDYLQTIEPIAGTSFRVGRLWPRRFVREPRHYLTFEQCEIPHGSGLIRNALFFILVYFVFAFDS